MPSSMAKKPPAADKASDKGNGQLFKVSPPPLEKSRMCSSSLGTCADFQINSGTHRGLIELDGAVTGGTDEGDWLAAEFCFPLPGRL